MLAVSVHELRKRFGAKEALRGVSFEVPRGELFGVIGPDGAGKTTLFRILVSLLVPDGGTARVDGLDVVADYRLLRARLGYMPGRFSLYQDLSVHENLTFFASIFGTTLKANYHLIKDIYVQIEPFRDRRAGALSGGMKQKLALCCALIHKPEVLFLDEPTTGVDAVSRQEFWDMLARLKADGLTIIVSTPYMDEAVRCDRVALMQEGRLLEVETPERITSAFDRPLLAVRATDRVATARLLRLHPHAASVYPFGEEFHFTDGRPSADPEELQQWLREEGLSDARVRAISAGIEDVFMARMQHEAPVPRSSEVGS